MSLSVQGSGASSPHRAQVGFDRSARGLTGIAIKGFLLSLVTFGIYRFWYMTDLRRWFWSRTVVAGSPAEYVGRGSELFLGFLVALVILTPVYLVLFALSFAVPAVAALAGPISFVFLFLLGQYAIFRGRRYRASRTLWRGIRLGQDGSALTYVAMATGWWLLTLLSLGLAFPWMRASLERYRIDHTLIGDSRMHSTARGRMVAVPWLLFYVIGLGPILASLVAVYVANDYSVPTDLFVPKPAGKPGERTLNPDYEGSTVASVALGAAIVSGIFIPLTFLLIPFYRARETRAFIGAAHLGEVRLSSALKARQFYWPYIVYFLSILGYVFVVGLVIGGVVALVAGGVIGDGVQVLLFFLIFVLYLASLLLFAVLYVRVVTARLWAAVASSTRIENVEALDYVLASGRPAGSGLNEGLADALDVGGALEIGF